MDASGVAVALRAPPRRIVSLIPSITETLFALGLGDAVIGCTVYCTQPPEGVAAKTRIGGEKNPKLELCFSEEACMTLSKTLERGKYLVLIS